MSPVTFPLAGTSAAVTLTTVGAAARFARLLLRTWVKASTPTKLSAELLNRTALASGRMTGARAVSLACVMPSAATDTINGASVKSRRDLRMSWIEPVTPSDADDDEKMTKE